MKKAILILVLVLFIAGCSDLENKTPVTSQKNDSVAKKPLPAVQVLQATCVGSYLTMMVNKSAYDNFCIAVDETSVCENMTMTVRKPDYDLLAHIYSKLIEQGPHQLNLFTCKEASCSPIGDSSVDCVESIRKTLFVKNYENEPLMIETYYPMIAKNMIWLEKPITVKLIHVDCSYDEVTDIRQAMEFWNEKSSYAVSFVETNASDAMLNVFCKRVVHEDIEGQTSIQIGEAIPDQIYKIQDFNVIRKANVTLLSKASKCLLPLTAIHEFGHILGFGHVSNPKDIMNPIQEDCSQQLSANVTRTLQSLYVQNFLPDLYFESVSAYQDAGVYHFSVTVANRGPKTSKEVLLKVIADGKEVGFYRIVPLELGYSYKIEFSTLIPELPNQVKLLIDDDKAQSELNRQNNVLISAAE